MISDFINTDYLNKNANVNLFILNHYLYSVSFSKNFRPLGLCQETNIWIYAYKYILYFTCSDF